jgi:hypothetical protein
LQQSIDRANGSVPILLGGNKDAVVGVANVRESDGGLVVLGRLAMRTQLGAEAASLLKMSLLKHVSLMHRPVTVAHRSGRREISATLLQAISLAPFGMPSSRVPSIGGQAVN